jgi:flagellar protein FlbT
VTPLKQLYFVVQLNLIEPDKKDMRRGLVEKTLADVRAATRDPALCEGLDRVHQLIEADRSFEALKPMRRMFAIEEELLRTDATPEVGREDVHPLPAVLSWKST